MVKAIGRFMFNSEMSKPKLNFKKVVLSILILPNQIWQILSNQILPSHFLSLSNTLLSLIKRIIDLFPNQIKIGRWPFRKTVYGPAPRLANTTIEELSYADTFIINGWLKITPMIYID
jgi:hypothetical protein